MASQEKRLKPFGGVEDENINLDDHPEGNNDGSVGVPMETSNARICKDHPTAVIIDDVANGQQMCSCCGTVVNDSTIDIEAEWLTTGSSGNKFNNEQARCSYADNGYALGSELVTDYQEAKKSIRGKKLREEGVESADDRAYRHTIINQVCKYLQISADVAREAKNIMQKCMEKRSSNFPFKQGKHLEGACLYVATRMHTSAIMQSRLLEHLKREKKIKVGKPQRMILRALHLSPKWVEPQDFIPFYCEELELPEFVANCAIYIANEVQKKRVAEGKNPQAIAAAVVYLASHAAGSKFARNKRDLAGVSRISVTTIGKVYKAIDTNQPMKWFPPNFSFGIDLVDLPLS